MRIVSGALRGKTISPPAGIAVRPTTDFAKESLFNILENTYDLTKVCVLDLFAGVGSISFEFASRGCPYIDAIDINRRQYKFIELTAKQMHLPQIHALRLNAFDFPNICTVRYDIIFADPPYELDGIHTLPDRILSANILNDGGVFIFEHSSHYTFNTHPCFVRHRQCGSVNFSFFH
jgi:16S rRNA (guanine(966)-N(2))-methyltransferase RsmD